MEDNFDDLQRLLRLKRHEAPPPDFMEDFLREFHHRQRAEMLKRPLWRLAMDRFEGMLPNFQFQRYAYAGSFAVVLLMAGVTARHSLLSPAATGTAVGSSAPVALASTTSSRSLAPESVLPARFDGSRASSRTSGLTQAGDASVIPVVDDQPPMRFNAPASSFVARSPRLDIYARRPAVSLADLDFDHPLPRNAVQAKALRNPRYVLDAQPVSYERPESF